MTLGTNDRGIALYGGFCVPSMGVFCTAALAARKGYNVRRATGSTKPIILP